MIIIQNQKGEIRFVEENKPLIEPFKLDSGEKVVAIHNDIFQIAKDGKIGFGDIVAKIIKITGLKHWWYKKYKTCNCPKRQDFLNSILRFKVPIWLKNWIMKD